MCTGTQIISKSGKQYWGRTQEFDAFLPVNAIIAPAGTTTTILETNVTSRLTILGISYDGSSQGIDFVEMADGVNEKGLAGGSFAFNDHYFRPASAESIKAAGKMPLRGEEFVTWALMMCGSCEELAERVNKEVAISNTPNLLGQVIGQHYVFVDRTGASIVIEPSIEGGFDVYDNPVRTFTNQPAFPWHLQNLQNYVGISDEIKSEKTFGDYTAWSPGKGSGLLGVPGDFTPQSRFVKAATMNALADAPEDELALSSVFHMLNSFDIPKGVVKSYHPLVAEELRQYTQYTSAYDLENLVVQISTYENRQIQELKLDLSKVGSEVERYEILHEEQVYTMKKI